MGTKQMRIGELAELVGVSPRSLRHYEQQGLLSPERSDNGYRVYDRTDVIRARNVKELLDAGLTTADVMRYLEQGCLDRPLSTGPRCAAELETAHERLAHLDELIERLEHTRHKLMAHTRAVERESATDRQVG